MKVAGHGQARILSSYEISELFHSFSSERDRVLFGVCFFTGCRINEACTMLSGDVFTLAGVRAKITIRKDNTKGKQETRQIVTNPQLRTYLEGYRDQAGKLYLFPGRHGRGHIDPRSADAILRAACARVGLEGVSTHSFQRSALTAMSSAGVPLRVIQEISGHRSLQALQRYLEVSEQQMENAVAVLSF
jgi:integrase/recombinase XerD